jgi:hypothetical protein
LCERERERDRANQYEKSRKNAKEEEKKIVGSVEQDLV